MEGSSWITLSRKEGPALSVNSKFYSSILPDRSSTTPSVITFVGRQEKSIILRELLGGTGNDYPQEHHGQVHLWSDPRTRKSNTPILLADYELQACSPSQWTIFTPTTGPNAFRNISWADHSKKEDFGTLVLSRILSPLSNIICFFAADLNGICGVAQTLATHLQMTLAHKLSYSTKPHILVDTNTTSKQANTPHAEMKLVSLLKLLQFLTVNQDAHQARFSDKILLGYDHLQAFCSSMVHHFCKDIDTPFCFLQASRPHGSSDANLQIHLSELLSMVPSDVWLWHLVVPLLSTTLLLAAYSPRSHHFSPSLAFSVLFRDSCMKAIQCFSSNPNTHQKFLSNVEHEMGRSFASMTNNLANDAKSLHLERLEQLQPLFKNYRSQNSCFCCMLRMPEKVLDCGHAYCDNCIKTFGTQSASDMHRYRLAHCIVCALPHSQAFTFMPPTAGMRILSMDGGGVRGITSLTILRQLEEDLEYLGCPLRDHFDFLVGTSSGGLIGIGMFLMLWSARECCDKFYKLVHETFGRLKNASLIISRLQAMLVTYLDDCQYRSLAIEAAFQAAFGKPPKMFNPLSSDTKVAVITAPVKGKNTSVICNYNGRDRPSNLGYRIMRTSQREDDIAIDEAASCTTAAPGYFKPKFLKHLGTHQDGALHHNNPAKIAVWEQQYLRAGRAKLDQPDFLLSIGTGTTAEQPSHRPHLPDSKRFWLRIIDAFDWNLDSEQSWKEIINFTPEEYGKRYHRVNLVLDTKEPRIDDVAAVDSLQAQTTKMITTSTVLKTFKYHLLASMFCFRLVNIDEVEGGYDCSGFIYNRLTQSKEGREALYRNMLTSASYFLVQGRPLPCVKSIPRTFPPFKRRVSFHVEDLNDRVHISFQSAKEQPWQISGLPRSLRDIIEAQGFAAPFGRSDHQRCSEYPGVLRKRPNIPPYIAGHPPCPDTTNSFQHNKPNNKLKA